MSWRGETEQEHKGGVKEETKHNKITEASRGI